MLETLVCARREVNDRLRRKSSLVSFVLGVGAGALECCVCWLLAVVAPRWLDMELCTEYPYSTEY